LNFQEHHFINYEQRAADTTAQASSILRLFAVAAIANKVRREKHFEADAAAKEHYCHTASVTCANPKRFQS